MTLSEIIWFIRNCVHVGCPRCSKKEHKKQHAACGFTFLMPYHKEGDNMLNHTLTGNETWVSHITPESKQQSLQWKCTGSPKAKIFKQTVSTRKIMCALFWDRQSVFLVEFLPKGTTINAVYCETLEKLQCPIQKKTRNAECWPFFFFIFMT
jgi:hypothetical protein